MRSTDLMITVASWEERCWLGFQRDMEKFNPTRIRLYFFKEYTDVTAANRQKIIAYCSEKGIAVESYKLTFENPAASWHTLYDTLTDTALAGKRVVIDITTMPRETIWTVLNLLEEVGAIIEYVYHQPERYNDEWLSRDPGRPRLVYKLAGEAKLGKPTYLLILTGYDLARVKQLITFFEPRQTWLGVQVGNPKWKAAYEDEFGTPPGIELFDVDAYQKDRGFSAIEKQLHPHLNDANIVMSSLGPKLSAIALYQLHKKYPETALAYAPSNEVNPQYSVGIGERFLGRIDVDKNTMKLGKA
jgi:hypothetical protein